MTKKFFPENLETIIEYMMLGLYTFYSFPMAVHYQHVVIDCLIQYISSKFNLHTDVDIEWASFASKRIILLFNRRWILKKIQMKVETIMQKTRGSNSENNKTD